MLRGGKTKIKAPRRGLAAHGAVDVEGTWSKLEEAFHKIHIKDASALSYEALYRDAYKLVLRKEGEALYHKLKAFEKKWLQGTVATNIVKETPVASLSSKDDVSYTGPLANDRRSAGEILLRQLKAAWEDHRVAMSMIVDVMTYLDRVYCNENHLPGLVAMADGIFRDEVINREETEVDTGYHFKVGETLVQVILGMIQMDRNGDQIDRTLIKACTDMLEFLPVSDSDVEGNRLYFKFFEPRYLSESRSFFSAESQTLLRNVDAATWCHHAQKRLTEEKDRCRSTLSDKSGPNVEKAVIEEFIKPCINDVVNMSGSGVKFMLEHDRMDILSEIYVLVGHADPSRAVLQVAVQARIEELGHALNAAAITAAQQPSTKATSKEKPDQNGESKAKPERPVNQQTAAAISWVDQVLELKLKYDRVLAQAFKDDKKLQTAVTSSFAQFINASDRSSEYLSLFFDDNLKKGIKNKTESEVDQVLDNGITLLRFVQDKDLFERYYKKHLARRLLMKRSVSKDAERQMISKMKMELGNQFTNRIESMFKDMDLSEELTRKYKEQLEGSGASRKTELSVDVLTDSMWPNETVSSGIGASQPQCIFPAEIQRIKQSFEKFYLDGHSGRKLTWQANMGTADIKCHFPNTKGSNKYRELNVSTYSMIILLLFEGMAADATLTYEEIKAITGIPDHDLVRNLQSLAVAPKTRILIKEPMSREVNATDTFRFNDSFHSPYTKVKVGVVSNANKLESTDERKETEKKNDEDRANAVDAAIVRIMKQRKLMNHQQLITEVLQQLVARFRPDVNQIKKRIEVLIEREYLERGEEVDRPVYKYLA